MFLKKCVVTAVAAASLLGSVPALAADTFDGALDIRIATSDRGRTSIGERRQKVREAVGALRLDKNQTVADFLNSHGKAAEQVDLLADKMVFVGQDEQGQLYQVPVYGNFSVASIVFDGQGFKKPFPAPISQVKPEEQAKLREDEPTSVGTRKPVVNSKHKDDYTGVIIDCRDITVEPMLMPVIKNDWGHVIYSADNFSYEDLCTKPLINYKFGDEQATQAGNKPLVLQGLSFEDGAIVLRTEDANRLLLINTICGFLPKANVVVLMP